MPGIMSEGSAAGVAPTCGGPSARRCAAPRRFGFAATWSSVAGGGLEQEVVHDALVDERETRERLRHREDDVDVADRQQLLLARRDPRVARRGQALRDNADPDSCCTRGPAARTGHSDRDARRAPRCGTARWPGGRADAGPSPRRGASPGSDRRVGARCRPPRRVAASPLVHSGAIAARGVGRRDRQRIQRIGDGLQMPLREVEIEHRVLEFHVPEQQLNRAQVGAGFERDASRTNGAADAASTRLRKPGARGGDDDRRPRGPSA